MRFYEELQNASATRFRVLGVVTRSTLRLQNIATLAASVATNPQRSLFLGVHLPDFLASEWAIDLAHLHGPSQPACVASADGPQPSRTVPSAREVLSPERTLNMIGV